MFGGSSRKSKRLFNSAISWRRDSIPLRSDISYSGFFLSLSKTGSLGSMMMGWINFFVGPGFIMMESVRMVFL